MYKKGQYFSFDAIIASVIFIMAIVLLLSYWHSVKVFLDYQTSDVAKETMKVASLLFVPSFPEGADCSGIENLGFDLRLNSDSSIQHNANQRPMHLFAKPLHPQPLYNCLS